jgi:hypothetical protein
MNRYGECSKNKEWTWKNLSKKPKNNFYLFTAMKNNRLPLALCVALCLSFSSSPNARGAGIGETFAASLSPILFSIAERRAEPSSGYQTLSFRTLRLYIPGKKPPQDVLEFNGKNVEIMGFMAALTQLEDIDEFVLASSPPMNCFCHPPLRVNEVVFVQMKKGKYAQYKGGVVRVRGKLTVNLNVGDEFADIMYTIECDEVV